MASENEPAKLLLPYLQRADELQKHEPLVAYYCRLYAMERGLNIPASERTKTTKSLLTSLMNQLEKDKRSLKLSPDDHLHLEGFALNVFAKADKQDRAGRADISTAKTFYAASIFFEILNQFGELAPDLEQKQKYAVWKAADIRKALKEGRKPVPGPPGNETGLSSPSSTQDDGGFDQINSFKDVELRHTEHNINPGPEPDPTPPPQFPDSLKRQPSTNVSPSPHQFPSTDYSAHTGDYPSHDYHPARPENTTYPQPYHTQSYPQEPQHPLHHSQNYPSQELQHPLHHSQNYPSQESQHPLHHSQNYPSQNISQNYPSQDIPSSYPNFQSYPSFSESSLPAAPSHYPSHYQGSDASYFPQSAPSTTNYAAVPQYNSSTGNGNAPDAPTTAQTYHYDSNYQVPPDKIAEAQKAARFAVGALAFDEVPVAVEHLKKALEMLTNPSAGQ